MRLWTRLESKPEALLFRIDVRLWMSAWMLSSCYNKRLNVGWAPRSLRHAVHRGTTSAHLPAAASASDSSHSWHRSSVLCVAGDRRMTKVIVTYSNLRSKWQSKRKDLRLRDACRDCQLDKQNISFRSSEVLWQSTDPPVTAGGEII